MQKISTTIVSFLHTWYIIQFMVDGTDACARVYVYTHTHTHTHIYIYIYTYLWDTHKHTPVPSTISYIYSVLKTCLHTVNDDNIYRSDIIAMMY
jgi:hypothetical protein